MRRSLHRFSRPKVISAVLAIAGLAVLALAVGMAQADPSVNAGYRIQMCHNGHTIAVDMAAVQTHLDHGDTAGPCP
jgi:hypothetical protein